MRGILVFLSVIATTAGMLFIGSAVVVPLGEFAKSQMPLPAGGAGVIDQAYAILFQFVPILLIGATGVWAVRWYLRREAIRGPR